ncbi:hypothetical protein PR202_gb09334 [Eleusine coracana subsp. coracana]|uniref:Uncharacterized protein n=1 Tax=Eleusine coracana subsp. coracana TaxID=191504 RepID=A0AAV5EHI4_ELECO|nr:hypothetical protein QOZ80_2BG0196170 [Eleusine coracana subsp. coracana]GJN21818.1 hypothetical protein PR202_gb09334 [Eleusine coracana subsp. coracana]
MSSHGYPFDSIDATSQAAPTDRPHITPPRHPAYLALYDLPTTPELLLDQNDLIGGGYNFSNNLTAYTGAGYLGGAAVGVFAGLRRAIVEAERGESAKLRANRVLNNCGTVGRAYANRAGVIAMLFTATKTGVRACRSDADDWVNTAVAGVSTGALFRSPGGLRAAVVGGVVGGLLAGAAILAEKAPVFNKSTPNIFLQNTTTYRSS